MNNSIPERFIFQCALFKNLEREVFMTHGYVDSHIIDQALRLRLKESHWFHLLNASVKPDQ